MSIVSADEDAIVQKLKETQDHLCQLENQSSAPDINTLNAQWNDAYAKQQSNFEGKFRTTFFGLTPQRGTLARAITVGSPQHM